MRDQHHYQLNLFPDLPVMHRPVRMHEQAKQAEHNDDDAAWPDRTGRAPTIPAIKSVNQ
jgi:hypothetical protein